MSWPGQIIANRSLPGKEGRDRQRQREGKRVKQDKAKTASGLEINSSHTGQKGVKSLSSSSILEAFLLYLIHLAGGFFTCQSIWPVSQKVNFQPCPRDTRNPV